MSKLVVLFAIQRMNNWGWIIHLTGKKELMTEKMTILLFWLTCGFYSLEKPVSWLQKCIFDNRQAALFDWHWRLILKGKITWHSSHRSHLGSVVYVFFYANRAWTGNVKCPLARQSWGLVAVSERRTCVMMCRQWLRRCDDWDINRPHSV